MNFNIRGENIEVTKALREYIEQKVQRIQKYFNSNLSATVNVNLKVYKHGQKVEVTIVLPKLVLRAEETHDDLYAAVDLVVDKLERQIRKHKTKVNRKQRERGTNHDYFVPVSSEPSGGQHEDEADEFTVHRMKTFELQPMDAQEAILQMNMLGHDFFLFINDESGKTNVVYRRPRNTYGLIETE